MRVLRSRDNKRLMIMLDSEAERSLVDMVFRRGMNTLECIWPALLDAHEQIKAPLAEPETVESAEEISV